MGNSAKGFEVSDCLSPRGTDNRVIGRNCKTVSGSGHGDTVRTSNLQRTVGKVDRARTRSAVGEVQGRGDFSRFGGGDTTLGINGDNGDFRRRTVLLCGNTRIRQGNRLVLASARDTNARASGYGYTDFADLGLDELLEGGVFVTDVGVLKNDLRSGDRKVFVVVDARGDDLIDLFVGVHNDSGRTRQSPRRVIEHVREELTADDYVVGGVAFLFRARTDVKAITAFTFKPRVCELASLQGSRIARYTGALNLNRRCFSH